MITHVVEHMSPLAAYFLGIGCGLLLSWFWKQVQA